MKRSMIMALAAVLLLLGTQSSATYDANLAGRITKLNTYDSGLVLIKLHNQPTTHPGCNPLYFGMSVDYSEAALARLYARALTAFQTDETVNIGYDSQGSCVHGYIRIHRIG